MKTWAYRRREYAEFSPVLPGIRKCRGHGYSDPCVPGQESFPEGQSESVSQCPPPLSKC